MDYSIENSSEDSDDSDSKNRCFKRELLNAVEKNNYDDLQQLLTNQTFDINSFINTADSDNNTLLHLALKKRCKRKINLENNEKIIDLIVKKGADINAFNNKKETPTHLVEKRLKTGLLSSDWVSINTILSSNKAEIQVADKNVENEDDVAFVVDKQYTQSQSEIETYCGNSNYQASGLKFSLHGVIYQLQLIMLFVKRATKTYKSFYLATEMDEAGKFDDVVLKYKKSEEDNWSWRFLQAKHILNPNKNPINKNDLFSCNQKLPFCLPKYLNSFCGVKQNKFFRGDYFEDFIICTNTDLSNEAKYYFTEEKCQVKDKILFFKNHAFAQYRLNDKAIHILKTNYITKMKIKVNEKDFVDFLTKFKFIVNFPNRKQLNRLIAKEMGTDFGFLDAELVTSSFENVILNWLASYRDKHSEYLLIKDGKSFLESIENRTKSLMISGLSMAYPEKLDSYGVQFKTISSQLSKALFGESVQLLELISPYPMLSCIKIAQILRNSEAYNIKDSFIFLSLKKLLRHKIQNLMIKTFSSPKKHNLLIIDCQAQTRIKSSSLNFFCGKLLNVICQYHRKKIVIISQNKNAVTTKLIHSNSGIIHQEILDDFKYDDLTETSKQRLLENKVCFQGQIIHLRELIDTNSAKAVVKGANVIELFGKKQVEIGSNKAITMDSDYYVNRTVRRQKVKNDILISDQFIRNNIVFVTKITKQELINLGVSKRFIFLWEEPRRYECGIIIISKEDEKNVFKMLCNICKTNIFWFENNEGKLFWQDFHGSAVNLRSYIENDGPIEEYIEEAHFCNIVQGKINLLAEGPGFGKSSFMTRLAQNVRSYDSLVWICRINLNEYGLLSSSKNIRSLNDINFSPNEIDRGRTFLLDMIFHNSDDENNLQRNIFDLSLRNFNVKYKCPKILLLMDGFDEISPDFKEKTLSLFKTLLSFNVTLWITSRLHEMQCLEDALESPALLLNPFNEQQKIEYLNKFGRHSDKPTEEAFDKICQSLKEITLNSTSMDYLSYVYVPQEKQLMKALQNEFTNVPLHLRMLAEVIFSGGSIPLEDMDIPFLYDKFINIKFHIYHSHNVGLPRSAEAERMRLRDIDVIREYHEQIAFNPLVPELAKEVRKIDIPGMLKVGLIVVKEAMPYFVHKSFQEFFVASFIARHIDDVRIQNFVFNSIFYDNHHKLIRSFLNKNEMFLSKLESVQSGSIIIEETKLKNILYTMLEENNSNITKPCLHFTKNFYRNYIDNYRISLSETSLRLLTDVHRKFVVLLNSLFYDNDFFDILFDYIIEYRNIYENFCLHYCPLHIWSKYYKGTDNIGILNLIYSREVINTKTITTPAEIIWVLINKPCVYGDSVLHIAAKRGYFSFIKDLITWILEKTKGSVNNLPDKINNFDDGNRDNPIMLCVHLFFMVNSKQETFLHVLNTDGNIDDLLGFLFEKFDSKLMAKLILQQEITGRTVLHTISGSQESNAMHVLLNAFKIYFNMEAIQEIIFKTDQDNRTVLHAQKNHALKHALDFATTIFDSKTLGNLLLSVDVTKASVLQNVVKYKDCLVYFLNSIQLDIFQKLIYHKDMIGQTVLHSAALDGDTDHKSIIVLLDFIKKNFGQSTVAQMLLSQDLDESSTVLHNACKCNDKILKEILSYILHVLGKDFFKECIFKKDINGRIGFHFAVANYDSGQIAETLLGITKNNLGDEILREMLMYTDNHNLNALHFALSENDFHDKAITGTLNFIKQNCDMNTRLQVLLCMDIKTLYNAEKNRYTCALANLKQQYILLITSLAKPENQEKVPRLLSRAELNVLYDYVGIYLNDKNLETELHNILEEYFQQNFGK